MLSNSSKKAIAFVSFLLFIGPVVSSNVYGINQNRWYVDDDNVDGPWDGSWEYPFQHIQDAIDNASDGDGDEIYVFDGFYQEGLYINKSVSLRKENSQRPIINVSINSNITICASNVNISGFKIIGSSKTTKPIVTIMNSNNTKIEHNNFDTFNGIKGEQLIEIITSRNVTLSYNEINNYNVGIGLTPHSHAISYDNDFIDVENYYYNAANFENDNNFYGLIQEAIDKIKDIKTIHVHSGKYFENLRILDISGLIIKKSEKAKESPIIDGKGKRVIDISNSPDLLINGFNITNSSQDGIFGFLSKNCQIYENIINNCWIGISLFHCEHAKIQNNIIKQNYYRGISIEMSVYGTIDDNLIENNTIGFSLIGAKADIKRNNFIFNGAHIMSCWLQFGITHIEENNFFECTGPHPFLIIDSELPKKNIYFHSNFYKSWLINPEESNWYMIFAKWQPSYEDYRKQFTTIILDTHRVPDPY